jgi:hypothetical protein
MTVTALFGSTSLSLSFWLLRSFAYHVCFYVYMCVCVCVSQRG